MNFPFDLSAYVTHQDAEVVIGQADMVSEAVNQNGGVNANFLAGPTGTYSDGTRLFLANFYNFRVLIYNSIPIAIVK
jgi:hypothetical protein